VRLIPFHGYVYDLTLPTHLFLANRIVVHNCNTPEPYPPAEKCCEYAKNTWWQLDVYATNDPTKVKETYDGANHIGGDKINLDYHLKYEITKSAVTYKGKYLKKKPDGTIRCPWMEGTAPIDP
jgi:hypothetical protein